jgi:ethanolaminephosphotransferase
MKSRNCPTTPKAGTEFEFYRKVQQSDVVPTIASLMGFPVPRNSLGVVLQETTELLLGDEAWVRSLERNAKQVLVILKASMGEERWLAAVSRHTHGNVDCKSLGDDEEEMACLWARASSTKGTKDEKDALSQFLYKTQDALSSTASSYDMPRMVAGVAIASASLILAVLAFPTFWPPSLAGGASTITTLVYGVMMFATSYVEEEQHFWYWITPAATRQQVLSARRLDPSERGAHRSYPCMSPSHAALESNWSKARRRARHRSCFLSLASRVDVDAYTGDLRYSRHSAGEDLSTQRYDRRC